MRVLHVLYSSYPDVTGASIRSRYLLETQAMLGIEPIVLSSPFQPPVDESLATGIEWINGIPHYRAFDGNRDREFMVARKSLLKRTKKLTALLPFMWRIRAVAQAEHVHLIHSHNLFFCGLSAALAARSLGLPVIYEVRSLTEETLVQQGGTSPGGLLYNTYRCFDALTLRLVTHITVISEGLRSDLLARGVSGAKITTIGNGVDLAKQKPVLRRDPALMTHLHFPEDAFILGYIGTLFTYESLDLLIDAVADLATELPKLCLLLVGEGDASTALRDKVCRQNLETRVRFTGRIAHDDIDAYYGLVDLFVLPRRRNRLTDLVTPLKPLEIMARAKPVLASDCGGHLELIEDGVNGYLFDVSQPKALTQRIRTLSQQKQDIAALGWAARQWVSEHRSWQAMVQPAIDLYTQLTRRAVQPSPPPLHSGYVGEL